MKKYGLMISFIATIMTFANSVMADEYSDCVQNNCKSCGNNCYYAYSDTNDDGVSDTLNIYGPNIESGESGAFNYQGLGSYYNVSLSNIKDINFNGNITSIADSAFWMYGLNGSTVTIPDSITNIGEMIFGDGNNNVTVVLSESRETFNLETIGHDCGNCNVVVNENTHTTGSLDTGGLIYCVGDLEKCVQNAEDYSEASYIEYDEEDVYEEVYIVQATATTENGVTTVKDANGNTLASYQAKSVTPIEQTKEVKRIYTVEEAAAVVKPTGNTFRIKYR